MFPLKVKTAVLFKNKKKKTTTETERDRILIEFSIVQPFSQHWRNRNKQNHSTQTCTAWTKYERDFQRIFLQNVFSKHASHLQSGDNSSGTGKRRSSSKSPQLWRTLVQLPWCVCNRSFSSFFFLFHAWFWHQHLSCMILRNIVLENCQTNLSLVTWIN